ncbi:hypothetical protein EL79_5186 [Escherichia coli]|nr:hypothetical protein EL79_5186 [Escherichia coli]
MMCSPWIKKDMTENTTAPDGCDSSRRGPESAVFPAVCAVKKAFITRKKR